MTNDQNETWNEVPGFDGWYEASSLGRVRSWKARGWERNVHGRQRLETPKILKPTPGGGYPRVNFTEDRKIKSYLLSEVLEAAATGRPLRETAVRRRDNHPAAKLTEAKVAEMRRLRDVHGVTYKALGEQYGVNLSTVWRAVNGSNWGEDA